MNNILRIGKVNVIGDVILFLGKLCVSLFCALFAFLMLDTHKYKSAHNKISSPLFPVLVCSLTLLQLISRIFEVVYCFSPLSDIISLPVSQENTTSAERDSKIGDLSLDSRNSRCLSFTRNGLIFLNHC